MLRYRSLLLHLHTYLMLPTSSLALAHIPDATLPTSTLALAHIPDATLQMGWGGVGWGGLITFNGTSTHT